MPRTILSFSLAGQEDVEAVDRLVHQCYRGPASRQGWTTEAGLLGGQRTNRRAVAELLRTAGSLLLLAHREQALVGCCHLCRLEPEVASFGMFAVAPALQGHGIGSALLAESERLVASEWGIRRLRLSVISRRDELVAFYRRRGFVPTGEHQPFPYGDERFGRPLVDGLEFLVLEKALEGSTGAG